MTAHPAIAPESPADPVLPARRRAATRKRLQATRIAARALSVWLEPALATSERGIAQAADRWLAKLGEENVRKLAMRMRRMADWEMLRAEQLRDAGASPWMLLKYVAASQDLELGGAACRDTIYTDLMQAHHRREQAKGRTKLLKAAVPLAVIGVVATLFTAGVGYLAATSAPLVGVDPTLAAEAWHNWQALFGPALLQAKRLLLDPGAVSSGFIFAMGAFWMWAHDSRIVEDLRAVVAEKEVPALESAIGFEAKGHRIQAAIRAIPPHRRILIGHFTSTDLRAFLLSTDEERIRMLRNNRPPLLAQFKSVLAEHPRTLGALFPAIRDLSDICLPKRWARAIGARHPGEIDTTMMESWRKRSP